MLKWTLGFCLIVSAPIFCSGNNKNAGISQEALKESMCNDLDTIGHSFEVKYAPAEWKKSYADWDLEEQINIAKAKIHSINKIKIADYQRILKSFFNSTQDQHVGVQFYSTAAAFLPFKIQGAEGRYFISEVESSEASNLSIGDEIVIFNDKPMQQVMDEFREQAFGGAYTLTNQALAEMLFDMRLGVLGHSIPEGPVTITVIPKGSKTSKVVKLKWLNLPERISDGPFRNSSCSLYQSLAVIFESLSGKKSKPSDFTHLCRQMKWYGYDALCDVYERKMESVASIANEEYIRLHREPLLGGKLGVLPALGQIIWEAPKTFVFRAYTFKAANGKTIGYIRIPSYSYEENASEHFSLMINLFNKTTDALIIDEINNPGGADLYTYALLSMLSPTPLQIPTQRITITQENVADALASLESFKEITDIKIPEGTPEDLFEIVGFPLFSSKYLPGLIEFQEFIISEWNAGRFYTNAAYEKGIKKITPHRKGSYSKPILVLVNSLSISCADFFPAILQDNKRATIFGTTTAGAGGYVISNSYPNRFGVAQYNLTGSLAERMNSSPIENLGVTPDVYYEVTADDLQNGYKGYIQAVNKAIEGLFKK